jgi:uncharacterized protein (TIGR02147 family)
LHFLPFGVILFKDGPGKDSVSVKSLFEYLDYREYLKDYFAGQKARNASFSYRYFSDLIGFKTKDFIFRVIRGQKNLSKTSVDKISTAMELGKRETAYFENLVLFNQAKTHDERERCHKRLDSIVKLVRYHGSPALIRHDQYRLFAQWYHLAVRSLIDVCGFNGDYAWLARAVYPAISPAQARKSVALLEKLGFIYRDEAGIFRITDKAITTGEKVERNALHSFYLSCLKHAGEALDAVPREQRNISGITLGISEKSYARITEKIQAFRREIAEIADNDGEADRVYQMNFLLFPVSNSNTIEGKRP